MDIIYLLSCLPLFCLYLLPRLVFMVLYYLIRYRRTIVEQNVCAAFPTQSKEVCDQIARKFYMHLSDVLIEHIKTLTITSQELLSRIEARDLDILEQFYKQGRSILLIAGHFGNWEWMAHATHLLTPYRLLVGYKPLTNHWISKIVMRLRQRFERKNLAYLNIDSYLSSHQSPPQAVGLLMDQAPYYKSKSHWMVFLNQPTAASLSLAKLAQKYNLPIIYGQMFKTKQGRYQLKPIVIHSDPATTTPEDIVTLYMRQLEQDIMKQPELWLWSHRRWK